MLRGIRRSGSTVLGGLLGVAGSVALGSEHQSGI